MHKIMSWILTYISLQCYDIIAHYDNNNRNMISGNKKQVRCQYCLSHRNRQQDISIGRILMIQPTVYASRWVPLAIPVFSNYI